MIAAEAVVVDALPPAIEHGAHARVGIGHRALHQRHVERVPVLAQVEVIEPRGGGPQVAGADREGLDAIGLQAIARGDEIGKGARRFRDPAPASTSRR